MIFQHNNMEQLEHLISKHGPGIIIVDSIFSSVGTICPLEKVVNIGRENDCLTIVDESHSLGLFGTTGEGTVTQIQNFCSIIWE